jgi:hypothetical protein
MTRFRDRLNIEDEGGKPEAAEITQLLIDTVRKARPGERRAQLTLKAGKPSKPVVLTFDINTRQLLAYDMGF